MVFSRACFHDCVKAPLIPGSVFYKSHQKFNRHFLYRFLDLCLALVTLLSVLYCTVLYCTWKKSLIKWYVSIAIVHLFLQLRRVFAVVYFVLFFWFYLVTFQWLICKSFASSTVTINHDLENYRVGFAFQVADFVTEAVASFSSAIWNHCVGKAGVPSTFLLGSVLRTILLLQALPVKRGSLFSALKAALHN